MMKSTFIYFHVLSDIISVYLAQLSWLVINFIIIMKTTLIYISILTINEHAV